MPSPTLDWPAYRRARRRFYEYRDSAGLGVKAALAVGLAAVTGLAAQVRIPLPFSPVPITLQTFAVLLAGIALGARWGGASQAIYAGLGAAGVPWFAGFGAGVATILGPTGGYIVGFVFAAAVVGYLTDRFAVARRLPVLLGILALANFGVIYGVSLPWLYGWLAVVQGSAPGLLDLLGMGLFPFVAGDIVKLVGAARPGRAIAPVGGDWVDQEAGGGRVGWVRVDLYRSVLVVRSPPPSVNSRPPGSISPNAPTGSATGSASPSARRIRTTCRAGLKLVIRILPVQSPARQTPPRTAGALST